MAVSKKTTSLVQKTSPLQRTGNQQYLDKVGPNPGKSALATFSRTQGAVKPLPEAPATLTPSVYFTVTPPLPASTFSNAEYYVTADTSVTFTAVASNAGTPGYQWYLNGTAINNATSSVYITSSIADSSSYSVLITSSYTPTTATYASSSVQVVRVTGSVPTAIVLTASIVDITTEPTSITFTAYSQGTGLSPIYRFLSGSTVIQSGSSNTLTYGAYVGDTYTVQFTSSFSGSTPRTSNTLTII